MIEKIKVYKKGMRCYYMSKEEIMYQAIIQTITETKNFYDVDIQLLIQKVLKEVNYEDIKSFQITKKK